MSEAIVDALSEKERAYLEHLQQAQKLEVSFAQYCRQKGLARKPWYWVRHGLVRKGVIAGRRQVQAEKPVGFVPVRIAPSATVVCRVIHPSGWIIECDSLPQVQWLTALLSGART
jgi:hypothetical protein